MIWNRAIYNFVSYDTIFLMFYHMIQKYIAEYFVSYDIISYFSYNIVIQSIKYGFYKTYDKVGL